MSSTLALKVETRLEELQRIAAAVDDLAERESWPPGMAVRVNLVIEEFGINVMNYGYDEGVHTFDINLSYDDDLLTIEIIDGGKPFNPLEDAPEPDTESSIEDRPIGGLGLFLVRTMTEDLQYRREDSKNHSTMVMRISE